MNKKLLIGLLLAVLIGTGIFLYLQNRPDRGNQGTPAQEQLDQMNAEDSTPTTEKDVPDETGGTGDTSNPKSPVTVTITQAETGTNLVEVRAYADIFEDGTCTATFTKGSETKTYTENTEQQAQYTQCNPFQIPKDDFSSGTWQVTVTFESAGHKGTSEAREVKI